MKSFIFKVAFMSLLVFPFNYKYSLAESMKEQIEELKGSEKSRRIGKSDF